MGALYGFICVHASLNCVRKYWQKVKRMTGWLVGSDVFIAYILFCSIDSCSFLLIHSLFCLGAHMWYFWLSLKRDKYIPEETYIRRHTFLPSSPLLLCSPSILFLVCVHNAYTKKNVSGRLDSNSLGIDIRKE